MGYGSVIPITGPIEYPAGPIPAELPWSGPTKSPDPVQVGVGNWRAYEWYPLPGVPITFRHQTDYSGWDDVWNWLNKRDPNADIDRYNKAALPFVQIELWVKQLVADTVSALGGQTNKILEFATELGHNVDDGFLLRDLFGNNLNAYWARAIDDVGKFAYNSAVDLANQATHNDRALQRQIDGNLNYALRYAHDFAIQEVYWPLDTKINHVNARIDNLPNQQQGVDPATVGILIAQGLAPLQKAIQGIQARLKPLEDEVTNCVEPMCDTIGPNTPGGNILKAIDWAKFLAFLAELALLDEKTAEDVALAAVAVGATPARDFVQLWFGI